MALTRVLLVDDDEILRLGLTDVLHAHGFEVTPVASVTEALRCMASESFDLLLSDLHLPGDGDGLTLVSAMRHASPHAVTILFSSYPEMEAASRAILRQADRIVVKPMAASELMGIISESLREGSLPATPKESLAVILERTAQQTIDAWLRRIHNDAALMRLVISDSLRSAHLAHLFRDLVLRLKSNEELGSRKFRSGAAVQHGINRHRQHYTAAMLVQESRMLQVSIFATLQENLATIDFRTLLLGVMVIADEVDSQLIQAMESFTAAEQRSSGTTDNTSFMGVGTVPRIAR